MRVDILTKSLTAASSQEQKPGWEQQKERIQNELEWCARDLARREKIVREVRKHVDDTARLARFSSKLQGLTQMYSCLLPRLTKKCVKTLCSCCTGKTW